MTDMEREEYEQLQAECNYLRGKLREEEDYRKWVLEHHLKGYIAGYPTRCISAEFINNHDVKERVEKTKAVLKRLSKDSILSADVREELYHAMWYCELYLRLRQEYIELTDIHRGLQDIRARKKVAQFKAQKEKAGQE